MQKIVLSSMFHDETPKNELEQRKKTRNSKAFAQTCDMRHFFAVGQHIEHLQQPRAAHLHGDREDA